MRFVLVHGGAHGAWCWRFLRDELGRLDHEAIAVELPGHGERRNESQSLVGYRDAVVEVLQPGDVLVGHSMGCMVATLAADEFADLAHISYIAGRLPVEGETFAGAIGGGSSSTREPSLQQEGAQGADRFFTVADDGTSITFDLDGARHCFYHDCSPEIVTWAFERLCRQRIDILLSQPLSLRRFWNADLPRSLIMCTEDQSFPEPFAQETAERLGVVPLMIESSHSPFLSRPAELADLLVEALDTKPYGPLRPRGTSG
jgi:pimeloyl-ACP methyl ester carboxylesterase